MAARQACDHTLPSPDVDSGAGARRFTARCESVRHLEWHAIRTVDFQNDTTNRV